MIEELIEKITNANDAYRLGNPIISDSEYDTLIEELALLDPDNEILNLKAKDIEQNSLKLFENLNEIKRVACK